MTHRQGYLVFFGGILTFILLLYLNGINAVISLTGSFFFLLGLLTTFIIIVLGVIALKWLNRITGYVISLATIINLYSIYQTQIQYFAQSGIINGWLVPPYIFGLAGGLMGILGGILIAFSSD